MRLILDLDTFIYRCGFAAEHTYYDLYNPTQGEGSPPVVSFSSAKDMKLWLNGEEGYTVEKRKEIEPVNHAIQGLNYAIRGIQNKFETADAVCFLSGKTNFRDRVATIRGYKANRKDAIKPVHYDALREYSVKYYGAEIVEDMEADDACGLEQNLDTILVTIDKDLDMIQGWHYNWVTKEEYYITAVEAQRSFYKQLLKGDAVDNIPGLYIITGKKCTTKAIEHIDTLSIEQDMFDYVFNTYISAISTKPVTGLKEAILSALIETGTLLYIRHNPDYKYWKPEYLEV